MKKIPTPPAPRKVPLPKNPDVEVVWHGGSTRYGERGQLLPDTHAVGSTWQASVRKLKAQLDAINDKQMRRG